MPGAHFTCDMNHMIQIDGYIILAFDINGLRRVYFYDQLNNIFFDLVSSDHFS